MTLRYNHHSGTQCHGPIAGEYHSHADTPGHTRVHNGDRHANTSILDGNVYPGINPRADDLHTYPRGLSCDNYRPPIPADIPEYSLSQWKHWIDEDGDCQDARQEALITESLVEVTFESERKSRVATGRWYGAFASIYVEAPGDLDIDHLVPLKNAHDSGGWAWSSARKEQYANNLGDPDHLIAVTKGANRSK